MPKQEKVNTSKPQPLPQTTTKPTQAIIYYRTTSPIIHRADVSEPGFRLLSSGRGVARMVTCCFSNSRTLLSSLAIVCRIVWT